MPPTVMVPWLPPCCGFCFVPVPLLAAEPLLFEPDFAADFAGAPELFFPPDALLLMGGAGPLLATCAPAVPLLPPLPPLLAGAGVAAVAPPLDGAGAAAVAPPLGAPVAAGLPPEGAA